MKKNLTTYYYPIDGSAPLSIYWFPGPYGDARESKEGNGVYFSAPNGELLGVQFDDVASTAAKQSMTTKGGTRVTVTVHDGKIRVVVTKRTHQVA